MRSLEQIVLANAKNSADSDRQLDELVERNRLAALRDEALIQRIWAKHPSMRPARVACTPQQANHVSILRRFVAAAKFLVWRRTATSAALDTNSAV